MRPGPSRRAFLKAAAGAAAAGFQFFTGFPAAPGLRVASTRPLPYPHHTIADPDTLPPGGWPAADVLLVPAYVAARLIAGGEALDLRGEVTPAAGRPHDPEGAFTLPQGMAFAALVSRPASDVLRLDAARPDSDAARSLAELWQPGAVWPDSARLALGAALMRRGYSPNDTHPGHLAQCERDLLRLRPRLAEDPAAAVRQGWAGPALALAAGPALEGGLQAALPAEGALYSEYDWVVPRRTARVGAALAFLRGQARPEPPPAAWRAAHAVPLAPLPAGARARLAALWARLRQGVVLS